jgi:Skp family chaperone for outer membrane proteins
MKKVFLIFAILLVHNYVWSEKEIAFVDMQKLFTSFYKTQLAQDQVRQQADEMQLEQDIMQSNIEEIRQEIEDLRTDSRDSMLSLEMRSNKRVLLEEKLIELQNLEQEMTEYETLRRKQIDEQNTRMTKKLFDEIQEKIVTYSREHGYIAVIDQSAQSRIGIAVTVYVDPVIDITEGILKELNEGYELIDSEEEEEK